MSRVWSWLVVVFLVLQASGRAAAQACHDCDESKAGELNNCLQDLVSKKTCFEWDTEKECPAAAVTSTTKAGPVDAKPFDVTCKDGKVTVTLVKEPAPELDKLAGLEFTLKFGEQFTATAKVPPKEQAKPPKPNNGDAENGEDDATGLLPIDVQPQSRAPITCGTQANTKYIYVHENLSVDPASAEFVTESDRVVVRFFARTAVLCRYYASSDAKNEYKPVPGRVGGREGLNSILAKSGLVGEGDKLNSCGVENGLQEVGTNADGTQRFKPIDDGAKQGYADFTFGPFTSEDLTFHVFRHDAAFKGNDLEGVVKVANHVRYTGWFDVSTVVSALASPHQNVSVRPQNGTEITRLNVAEESYHLDLVAQVKLFLACTGEGNHALESQDLQTAGACLGVGSGFSLIHPTRRFYPLGLNVTVAHYLSLNALLSLEKATTLAGGYKNGDIYSGSANDIITHNRLVPGIALGIGLDPTLLGEIVGAIVKAGIP